MLRYSLASLMHPISQLTGLFCDYRKPENRCLVLLQLNDDNPSALAFPADYRPVSCSLSDFESGSSLS